MTEPSASSGRDPLDTRDRLQLPVRRRESGSARSSAGVEADHPGTLVDATGGLRCWAEAMTSTDGQVNAARIPVIAADLSQCDEPEQKAFYSGVQETRTYRFEMTNRRPIVAQPLKER